jgi:hypothetical protein
LIPYAGGVAGYNSDRAVIRNSYSTMNVSAVSQGKAALAGGVVGATANTAVMSKCYAAGTVRAEVRGTGAAGEGIGVPAAANAGGVSGSVYVGSTTTVEACAALGSLVEGADTASEAVFKVYRVAGKGTVGILTGNIAWSGMALTEDASPITASDTGGAGQDGADCGEKPAQSVFEGMGWDFAAVWKMDDGGYPVLRCF